jgi:hypothetical protein
MEQIRSLNIKTKMPKGQGNANDNDSYYSEDQASEQKVDLENNPEVTEAQEKKAEVPLEIVAGTVAHQELERKRKEAEESKQAYEDGKQFEIDIAKRKREIIADDKKKNKKLNKHFEKRNSYDGGKGLCLCKFENETGVRIITIIDILIFWNLPRFIAALVTCVNH